MSGATERWCRRMGNGRLAVRVGDVWQVAPVRPCDVDEPPVGPVVPARITAALDLAGMVGVEVDEALGVEGRDLLGGPVDAGVVDAWEAGTVTPSLLEVRRLATLTGVGLGWFYEPAVPVSAIVCGRGGCRTVTV